MMVIAYGCVLDLKIGIMRGSDRLLYRLIVLVVVGKQQFSAFVRTVYVLCSFISACHLQVDTTVYVFLRLQCSWFENRDNERKWSSACIGRLIVLVVGNCSLSFVRTAYVILLCVHCSILIRGICLKDKGTSCIYSVVWSFLFFYKRQTCLYIYK